MTKKLRELTHKELCALVITKAIRNDTAPMVHFIQELRRQGFDDLEVGRLFTETAMIIFGETWPEEENEEEMKPPATAGEREAILSMIEDQICFDHLENKACEHQGCYQLIDLYRRIEGGKHLA